MSPRRGALTQLVLVATLVATLTGVAPATAVGLQVEGTSMAPSLHPGQLVLINRATYLRLDGTPLEHLPPGSQSGSPRYLFGGPQRGDLVVFRSPTGASGDYVKRVIGLPGDSVLVDAGRVFVNGELLDEPYVVFQDDYSYPVDGRPAIVPDGAYFVLGDNRQVSADSHLGWFVPANNLLGQARPLP